MTLYLQNVQGYRVKPWQYPHSTQQSIHGGRPITAEEGRWLIDEIRRLEEVERLAKYACVQKKLAADSISHLEAVLFPPKEGS